MLRRTALWLIAVVGLFWLLFHMIATAQTILPPLNAPVFRALDANGQPLAGGLLYSYAAGTSTPLATYADANGVTPNANPVTLDSAGRAKVFLGSAVYKFVLQDANGVQQWTVDSISGQPTPSAVTSVFGRAGAVMALVGDYTCAQVTGAICTLPTVYYQTVQVNGTAQTQRSNLNLIAGTGAAVTCADNASNNSTDCTVAAAAAGTPRTCTVNGCYYILADGTIEAWGKTGAFTGGSPSTILVPFPVTFTDTTTMAVHIGFDAPCTNGSDSGAIVIAETYTTSGFTAWAERDTGVCATVTAHWHATGY